MKAIKVSEATGAALDWLVAKCEGLFERSPHVGDGANFLRLRKANYKKTGQLFSSTDWSQGGPIIERGKIGLSQITRESGELVWVASAFSAKRWGYGPTPLIAAMRCYVASKLGETVEVPEELS